MNIYEQIRGAAAVSAAVDRFYAKVSAPAGRPGSPARGVTEGADGYP